MSETHEFNLPEKPERFDAFDVSPVPAPGSDAKAPDVFRGIYGMPMFVTIPTPDLGASVEFWERGLGFVELFGIPGRLAHMRRWVFQDALLVPGASSTEPAPIMVSFSCVLDQIEGIVQACSDLLPGSASEPRITPWNSLEVEVRTPENARVVLTAAREFDVDGPEAANLETIGIKIPRGPAPKPDRSPTEFAPGI